MAAPVLYPQMSHRFQFWCRRRPLVPNISNVYWALTRCQALSYVLELRVVNKAIPLSQ